MVKPVTPEQSKQILRLVKDGLDRSMIAERVGVTPAQVSALKAVANRGKRPAEVPSDDEVGEALETTFGLERDLQKWLRQNIRDLEDRRQQ